MSGLVGHWPLHDSSGHATDLSGNDNHGTLRGGVTQGVAGNGGLQAYSFSPSTGDSVNIPNIFTPESWGGYTIACWVRANDISNGYRIIDIRQNHVGGIGSVNDSTNELYVWHNNSSNSGQTVHLGVNSSTTWHFIVATWDGSTLRGYINGERAGSTSASGTTSDGYEDSIGSFNNSKQYWDGQISNVRFYNRALSDSEIKTLHEWGGQMSPEQGTSLYRLNGTVTDVWGDNHGSASNVSFVDGKFGQAGEFNGSSSIIDLPSDVITTGQQFTVSAWAKHPANSSQRYLFDARGDIDHIIGFADNPDVSSTSNAAYWFDGQWYDTGVAVDDGAYHLWTVTTNGSHTTAYVDGEVVHSTSHTTADSYTGTPSIGAYFDGAGSVWNGTIDNLAIYPWELSPTAVSALYNNWTDLIDPRDDGVARYRFDDTSDTTTAVDSWGSNHGTINGATHTANAIRGGSIAFTSANDEYVDASGVQAPLVSANAFTISFWVKYNVLDDYDVVIGHLKNDTNKFWIEPWRTSSVGFSWEWCDSSGNEHRFVSDHFITENDWYHMCITYDGSTARSYINGSVVLEQDDTFTLADPDGLTIGKYHPSHDSEFNGIVDDVRFYDVALTPSAVADLYQWGTFGRDMRARLVNK